MKVIAKTFCLNCFGTWKNCWERVLQSNGDNFERFYEPDMYIYIYIKTWGPHIAVSEIVQVFFTERCSCFPENHDTVVVIPANPVEAGVQASIRPLYSIPSISSKPVSEVWTTKYCGASCIYCGLVLKRGLTQAVFNLFHS